MTPVVYAAARIGRIIGPTGPVYNRGASQFAMAFGHPWDEEMVASGSNKEMG